MAQVNAKVYVNPQANPPITVVDDPLRVKQKLGKDVTVTWKIMTDGWVFQSVGIVVDDPTGPPEFTNVGATDSGRTYTLTDVNSIEGLFNYTIFVQQPGTGTSLNSKGLSADPTICNET